MALNPEKLEDLIASVTSSAKYAQIEPGLVRQICITELSRHSKLTSAIKSARTHLHQLTGAYLPGTINYAQWINLFEVNPQLASAETQLTLQALMRLHASTAERIPFLETFFHRTLESIPPPCTILDLACGLNPLAIPWMPLGSGFRYFASDVVNPLLSFLNRYFQVFKLNGVAEPHDLLSSTPLIPADLTLLLKTLPLLDQVDKTAAPRLLDELKSSHILISYPLKSLGGRSKGMEKTYRVNFESLISNRPFVVKEFSFPNELVFLLSRDS